VHIHEEIPVPAEGDRRHKTALMTQQIARVFEEGIREHPQDWHMLQRVFVADLDPDRLASARAKARARDRPANGSAAGADTEDSLAGGAGGAGGPGGVGGP